jgi:hypothetical protein
VGLTHVDEGGTQWQSPSILAAPLPDAADALAWDVELTAQLELVKQP